MFKKLINNLKGKYHKPENLEECFSWFDRFIKDKESWAKLDEKTAVAKIHLNFGMWMRNEWGLWGDSKLAKWFKSQGIEHADDMSGIILDSYHRKLNNKPIDLENQIESYKNHWKNIRK